MNLPYKSPDNESTWSLVFDLVLYLVLILGATFSALSGHTAQTVLLTGCLVLNQLQEIYNEVRASRRIAEAALVSANKSVRWVS